MHLAVVEGADAILVSDLLSDPPATLQQLIEGGEQTLDALRSALDGDVPRHPLDGWDYASAVIAPLPCLPSASTTPRTRASSD